MEFLKEFINIFFVLALFYTLWLLIWFFEEWRNFFKRRIEVKNIVYSLNVKDEKDYKEIMNLIEEIGKQKFK